MRPLDRLRWLQGCVPFIKMSTFSRPRSLPRPAHEVVALKKYKDKIFGPFPVEEVIDQDYAISVALPPHLDLVWPVMHPWHLRPAKHPKFRNRPIKFLEPDPTFPVEELRTSGSQKHPTKKALPSQVQRTRPTVHDVATRIPDQLQTHHHRLLETTQNFWHRR